MNRALLLCLQYVKSERAIWSLYFEERCNVHEIASALGVRDALVSYVITQFLTQEAATDTPVSNVHPEPSPPFVANAGWRGRGPHSAESHAESLASGEAEVMDTTNGMGVPDSLYTALKSRSEA